MPVSANIVRKTTYSDGAEGALALQRTFIKKPLIN